MYSDRKRDDENLKNFNEVEHIHLFGSYIGNYPSLSSKKIIKICSILNSVNYDI